MTQENNWPHIHKKIGNSGMKKDIKAVFKIYVFWELWKYITFISGKQTPKIKIKSYQRGRGENIYIYIFA